MEAPLPSLGELLQHVSERTAEQGQAISVDSTSSSSESSASASESEAGRMKEPARPMDTEESVAAKRKEEHLEEQTAATSPTTNLAKATQPSFLSRLSPTEDAAYASIGQQYVETSDITDAAAEVPQATTVKMDARATGVDEEQAAHVSAQASSSSGLGIPIPDQTFATPLPPEERWGRNQRQVTIAESPRSAVMHLHVNPAPPKGTHAKVPPGPLWHFAFRDNALNAEPETCPTVSEVQHQAFKSVRISLGDDIQKIVMTK